MNGIIEKKEWMFIKDKNMIKYTLLSQDKERKKGNIVVLFVVHKLSSAVQYSTVQYSTVQYNIAYWCM